ncbi:primosomal replication protein N [Rhizobium sp. Root274]|uniref:HK97 family phage prohead protease n=1 Tax=unclassified Rhizobium TaxID=2613769 RepID=UPI0007159A91|nr:MULTISPECIES: HK97 family phage prohead protease [unclassified Rhizobium]KQW31143.1 primosomal replication protein N [Rhizobium sp. Root1240]KRD32691.1 primosomal replication protein N [Rhizobium sp. Root274]
MQRREGLGAPSFRYTGLTLKGVAGDGTFSGYASLFGEVDLGRDAIERGAFAASIDKRGAGGVRMLFQHDPAEVIGRWTVLREDERGLYVEGKLATDVERAREVLALMKAGALDGLSIGFRAVKTRADRKAGVRRILEADLWEISVVTFPMLPTARVSNVKHRRFYRDRETELVRLMRRAARAMANNHFTRG